MSINLIHQDAVARGLRTNTSLRTQTEQKREALNLSASRSAGFTLIELLVVIAIIAILIGPLLPPVRGHYLGPLDHHEIVQFPNTTAESPPSDLLVDASLGDAQIVFERRIRKTGNNAALTYLVIKLDRGRVASFDSSQRIDLRAMLDGADALQGSLPYALAWLTGNTDPLGSVRALGYDIGVVKEHERPCADQLASEACVNLGRQLAGLIDATLGFGSPEDRAQFRRDASAIGVAPDCATQEP